MVISTIIINFPLVQWMGCTCIVVNINCIYSNRKIIEFQRLTTDEHCRISDPEITLFCCLTSLKWLHEIKNLLLISFIVFKYSSPFHTRCFTIYRTLFSVETHKIIHSLLFIFYRCIYVWKYHVTVICSV